MIGQVTLASYARWTIRCTIMSKNEAKSMLSNRYTVTITRSYKLSKS